MATAEKTVTQSSLDPSLSQSNSAESDIMKEGDTITFDGEAAKDEPRVETIKPRRRTSPRKRIASLRERIAAGTASDSDIEEVKQFDEKHASRKTVPSPSIDVERPAQSRAASNWQSKYGGGYNGRETVCVTLASYWHGAACAFAKYIEDNGGTPIFDPTITADETSGQMDFRGMLVLAVDEMLPPHVTAAPKLIALTGTASLAAQAGLIAAKKRKEKAPAKRMGERSNDVKDDAPGFTFNTPSVETTEATPTAEPPKTKKPRPVNGKGEPVV